jgi:hypothetical protein
MRVLLMPLKWCTEPPETHLVPICWLKEWRFTSTKDQCVIAQQPISNFTNGLLHLASLLYARTRVTMSKPMSIDARLWRPRTHAMLIVIKVVIGSPAFISASKISNGSKSRISQQTPQLGSIPRTIWQEPANLAHKEPLQTNGLVSSALWLLISSCLSTVTLRTG